jgi:hypothetical protein
MEDVLYDKLLDTKLHLRDTHEHFNTYSAQDLIKLIKAALNNTRKVPQGIKLLYELEQRIAEIRQLLEQEKLENLMGK